MELIKSVNEMTTLINRLDQSIIDNLFDKINNTGEHIGDLDGFKILKTKVADQTVYGLIEGDEVVSIITFSKCNNKVCELNIAFTKELARNKHHIKRLMWFLKDQEGLTFIDSGIQSEDGINFIKSLSKSERFKIFWFNIKSKERVEYDAEKDNKYNKPYRDLAYKTDWRILIEGNEEPVFQRYCIPECVDPNLSNIYILFELK